MLASCQNAHDPPSAIVRAESDRVRRSRTAQHDEEKAQGGAGADRRGEAKRAQRIESHPEIRGRRVQRRRYQRSQRVMWLDQQGPTPLANRDCLLENVPGGVGLEGKPVGGGGAGGDTGGGERVAGAGTRFGGALARPLDHPPELGHDLEQEHEREHRDQLRGAVQPVWLASRRRARPRPARRPSDRRRLGRAARRRALATAGSGGDRSRST